MKTLNAYSQNIQHFLKPGKFLIVELSDDVEYLLNDASVKSIEDKKECIVLKRLFDGVLIECRRVDIMASLAKKGPIDYVDMEHSQSKADKVSTSKDENKNTDITFLYGMGERKDFPLLLDYFNVPEINWNTFTVQPSLESLGRIRMLGGFSMGAIAACEYAAQHEVDVLLLCSMTPGVETINNLKAKKVLFLIGEKERWVIKENKRVMETLPASCARNMVIIPNADHVIDGVYIKSLLKVVNEEIANLDHV